MVGPSIYHDWIALHGCGQLHVGVFVESVGDEKKRPERAGIPAIQTGSGYGLNGDRAPLFMP
jgi:methylmalonyl-CoA/ethylmalonyl-CoA epimerase